MPSEETIFISEEVRMIETSEGGEPILFEWREVEHRVTDIVRYWQDWGHSPGAFKKSWKNRRHRNCFEIRTDQGFYGLIYFDRGVKPSSPRTWVIRESYSQPESE